METTLDTKDTMRLIWTDYRTLTLKH